MSGMAEMKKTKLGLIPEDWELKKIEEISDNVFAGATPSTRKSEFWNGDIPWMSSGEINKKMIWDTEKTITPEGFKSSSTKIVPKDSVLIALAGQGKTRGTVAMNKIELCTNQSLASIVPNDKVESKYLYYNLDFRYDELRRMSTGDGGRGGLNLKIINKINVGLPPLSEQKKIAKILSTWDMVIELKEKLIEQKKEQKKGLMEKLLIGEVRLPGYESVWQEVRLGSILKERKETGYEHLELLAITNQKGVVRRTEVDIKDNSSADKSKYKRICPNDIGYNTMRMWQGVSGVSKYEGIVSPAYTILNPLDNVVDSRFMGYLFKLPEVVNLFKRYSQGLVSDTLNLKYENFKNIRVVIPSDIKEQHSISKVLLCIDKEIDLLQMEIAAINLQKKGLMQLLLTGNVRVKV